MVLWGPYSLGQSCQRQPIFRTCMIPLRMRRSSFRSGPGWFVGRCGMIFAHCSSSNQNKFESIRLGSLQVDQAIESNEPCLGLEPSTHLDLQVCCNLPHRARPCRGAQGREIQALEPLAACPSLAIDRTGLLKTEAA